MNKFQDGDIDYSKSNKLVKWFKNYWYYYKWIVIGIAFAIIVVTVCTVQTCNTVSEDITIMYAGPFPSADISVENMQKALSSILPDDYNGDGEKNAVLAMLSVYSEEQMKAIDKDPTLNVGNRIDRNTNAGEYNKFNNLVMASDYYLCMLDPWLFEQLYEGERLMPLQKALGYKPDNAINDYAVRLSDTQFGKYFEGIKALPIDTYVCIKIPSDLRGGEDSEKFLQAKAMLKAILEYEYPDDFNPNIK